MNSQVGDCLKRSEVNSLSVRRLFIVRKREDRGYKISDTMNVPIWQKSPTHFRQVQPFIWRTTHRSVIKIEPVNIYVYGHHQGLEMQ